jgi:conjugative transfer signal peptidase TraF
MKRVLFRAVMGWLALLAATSAASAAGLRVNASKSVPRGFYWLTSDPPARGGYVAVCPPPAPVFDQAKARGYLGPGRCDGNFAELIKVLAAGPGDQVRIDGSGVRVGGHLWPASSRATVDAAGRAMPVAAELETTLAGSVVVMSADCELGFDSRYFGPLPSSAIQAAAIPLLTW